METQTLDQGLKEFGIIGLEKSSSQGFRTPIAKYLKYFTGNSESMYCIEPQRENVGHTCENDSEVDFV